MRKMSHAEMEGLIQTLRERLESRRGDCVPVLGVRAIAPAEVHRQRGENWVDFHPERFCHRCGTRNVRSWSTDSELWNAVLETHEIVCPQCFTELWEAEFGGVTWVLSIDPLTR